MENAAQVPEAIEALNNYAFQDQEGVEYTITLRPMFPQAHVGSSGGGGDTLPMDSRENAEF